MNIISVSGGQDSTTCALWAKVFSKNRGYLEAVHFNYGQRNQEIEQKAAEDVCRYLEIPLHMIDITDLFNTLSSNSALLSKDMKVEEKSMNGLPNTFVPGRNIILLTFAATIAYNLKAEEDTIRIITGVCETDYSGYPDCRDHTMHLLARTLGAGLDKKVYIDTPLMFRSKKDTVELFYELGGTDDLMRLTHTCYYGKIGGCEECPACKLRVKGFVEAGRVDPTIALRQS